MYFELLTFLSATNSFSTVVRLLISSSYLLEKKKRAEPDNSIRHTDINYQVEITTFACSETAIRHCQISVWRANIRPSQDQKLLHEGEY